MTIIIKQIGNRFALTAAHCLYDNGNEELLPASYFSIMLGLHDRRKTKEQNRYMAKATSFAMVNGKFYVLGNKSESIRFSSIKISMWP